ncbi:TonB-dependent siderophore receptor [Methylocaldum sp. MU1018]
MAAALAMHVPVPAVAREPEPAVAPSTDTQAVVQFDIPAQDLASALTAFSTQSRIQVLYEGDIAQVLRSTPLKGAYVPAEALRILLSALPVQAHFIDPHTVTLKRRAAEAQANPSEQGDIALGKITVTARGGHGADDPYNKDYAVLNAVTATKTDTPIMETPVSVQTVSRPVMDDQQAISVGDALKNVSGIQSGAYTFYDNFMLRGFDTGLGNTYRNGLRQTSISFLETANLERIEVLKGPAAVLFGRIEPGGLVNLATKRPLDEAYYSVQQQFGSYDLYRTTVDATGPLLDDRSLLYRMNIAYKSNRSFRDFVSQEHVFVAPSLAWQPADRLAFNLDVEYQYDEFVEDGSDSGIPAIGNRPAPIPISRYLGDSTANRRNPNTQERVLVGLDWSYRFNGDWKLTNRFQYLTVDYDQTILFANGLRPDNRTLDRSLWRTAQSRSSYGTNLDLTGRFATGIAEHAVLAGLDFFRLDQQADGFSGDTPLVPPIDIFDPVYGVDLSSLTARDDNLFFERRDQWYGIYFQDQITLWDKLHILGGGRQDWAESGSGSSSVSFGDLKMDLQRTEFFSPRVGVLYQPWPWLSLYGNYIESFGSNNGGRSVSGKPFDPQTAEQYEVGIKTEFFGGRLNSTLAFYDLTKQNSLTPDSANPGFSVAIGEARSRGAELDVAGRVTENWSLIGSYAYTDTEITKDNSGNKGNRFAAVPRNSGSFWAKYEFDRGYLRGLSLGTGVYIRGRREGDNANTFQLPGYVRWDASVGYSFEQFGSRITTQLNVYNLLDKTYYDHSSFRANIRPGEPLTFLGSLRVEY